MKSICIRTYDNRIALHLQRAYGFEIVHGENGHAIDFTTYFNKLAPDLVEIKCCGGKGWDLKCYMSRLNGGKNAA